jgi:hypothetical protein
MSKVSNEEQLLLFKLSHCQKNGNSFDTKIGKLQFFFKLTELNLPYGKCALANNRANEISSISFWPDDLPKRT